MRYSLFHLGWAALSMWVFSPFWYHMAGRSDLPDSYQIYLPAAILALAVLQWAAEGGAAPLPLRASPWILLVLVAVLSNWPAGFWLGIFLAGTMVLANLLGMTLCLVERVRRPQY